MKQNGTIIHLVTIWTEDGLFVDEFIVEAPREDKERILQVVKELDRKYEDNIDDYSSLMISELKKYNWKLLEPGKDYIHYGVIS